MPEILLVRHAESEANAAAAWQGRGDAGLSAAGREQVAALGRRVEGQRFDAVVSSPLTRAYETAAAFSDAPEIEEDLIEIDLGRWEGVPFDTVAEKDGVLLRSIYNGADEPFGGIGERMSEVAARAWSAIDRLAERVGETGRAVVVTHGGVLDSLLSTLLPTVRRRPHRMASNASLTHLVGGPGHWRLKRFNDTAHLGRLSTHAARHLEAGDPVVALIRHGRTRANVDGRFQGQSCWGLDDVGAEQARWLAKWYGRLDRVYTSPLARAADTAAAISATTPVPVDGLKEIGLGVWEGLTWKEVWDGWADVARRIYEEGQDLPRGEHGETWAEATRRMAQTVASLELAPGEITGVVTHGGVIRAYIGTLSGDTTGTMSRLATPENTSVTHVAMTADGPVLCDYAVAPHLESTTEAAPR